MKKLLSLTTLLLLAAMVFAQTQKSEFEMATDIFGMGKKAMVANFVELPETDVFWTIYEEYEAKRSSLSENAHKILLEYAGNYVNYSDDRAGKIMDKVLKQRKDLDKVLTSYYKKVKKECGPKTATQFFMVERFFDATLRAEALGRLPIIEN